jgi:hypothetical protein
MKRSQEQIILICIHLWLNGKSPKSPVHWEGRSINPRRKAIRERRAGSGIGYLRFRLDRIGLAPGIKPTLQCAGIKAQRSKLARRTGAGGFIRSGTVSYHRMVSRLILGPIHHLIRQHPHAAGDLCLSVREGGAGTDIQDDGRKFAG